METKTLQQVFDEALKDKAMKSKLLKAIKEKKLPDFMKAHGCNATMEEAIFKGLIGAGYNMKRAGDSASGEDGEGKNGGGVLFSVRKTDRYELPDLARKFYDEGNYKKAIELTGKFYEKNPDNFHVGDTYAKSLIADGQYEKAEKVLAKIRILPFEGQSGSRALYRNTKLQLAAAQADKGNVKAALAKVQQARMWPENLGVGRPYDDLVDERTEDWLSAVLYKRLGDTSKAEEYLSRLTEKDPGNDWEALYKKATTKVGKKWPKVSEYVRTGNVPVDKKLF